MKYHVFLKGRLFMNLMKKIQTFSFSTTALRTLGALFLLLGLMGTLMQTKLLGIGLMTGEQLLEMMTVDSSAAFMVAISLVLNSLEACAVPLYAFLLVEGATHTSNFGKYMIRVLGLAVVCQLPYNLVTSGHVMIMQSLNPAFAAFMSLVMLYFFRRFREKKLSHIAIKALAIVGTFLWSNMLGISHGGVCVLLTAVLWALRGRENLQTLAGMIVTFASCIFSLYYLAAPISFLILHFYEGKKGNSSRLVNYGVYPALLVFFGVLTVLL